MRSLMLCLLVALACMTILLAVRERTRPPEPPPKIHGVEPIVLVDGPPECDADGVEFHAVKFYMADRDLELGLPCPPGFVFKTGFGDCRCPDDTESICIYEDGKLYSGWPAGKCPEKAGGR